MTITLKEKQVLFFHYTYSTEKLYAESTNQFAFIDSGYKIEVDNLNINIEYVGA